MAVVSKDIIRQAQSLVGGTPSPYTFQEGATQTYVKGEIVFLSGGYCIEIAGDTPSQLLGVAAQPAHNDAAAGTHVTSVFLAEQNNVFTGNLLENSLVDHVLVQADIGKYVAIQRDTTNSKVYLDVSPPNGGAGTRAVILAVDTRTSAIGDTNARVLFKFLPNFYQLGATS